MGLVDSFIDGIVARSEAARAALARTPEVWQWVDQELDHIPRPYCLGHDIRLVLIGQDPTVQDAAQRKTIKTVLMLDENKQLRHYAEGLCIDLGLSLDEHVYATNACKCFFTKPPLKIKQDTGFDVLAASAPVWLPILCDELAQFPNAIVISLGEPVLSMLVREGFHRDMKYYWGYERDWRKGASHPFCAIEPEASTVARRMFPFVHQPTSRGARTAFYRERRAQYSEFIRHTGGT